MTNEAPNHVTAEVDQAQPKKTKDGVRFLVTLGFPFKANKAIAMMLMEQDRQPAGRRLHGDTGASSLTCRRPSPARRRTFATPSHKTTVDGVEAKVMLPVTEGGRRNKIAPHPYKDDPENKGKCLWCNHGEAYQAHEPARIEAAAQAELAKVKSNGHRANPDEKAAEGRREARRCRRRTRRRTRSSRARRTTHATRAGTRRRRRARAGRRGREHPGAPAERQRAG
jgi:hypothetical protein